jgi:uncharacterized protein (DUF3084 family)
MYGVLLIAIIAVMGGAIAYIGDKLGTKVGKKKLTIFGLRPKHTSILVTIITGILIAASTLSILSLVSRDVRTALFGMQALKAELASLSQEVTAKSTELDASRQALEEKNQEYSSLNAKVQETTAKLNSIAQELAAVTTERDRTAAALQQMQDDYAVARGDLEQSRQEIAGLQQTKAQLDQRIGQLTDARTALQSDVDRLNTLTSNLRQGLQIVREGAILYRAGEVLLTATIQGSQNTVDVNQALTAIIYRANQVIVDRLGLQDKSTEVLWLAKAEFDQAAGVLAENPGQDVVVRITSSGNTVYGEPVIGHIELYPNHLVYPSGSIVYSETVSAGRRDSSAAEEIVLSFLQKVNTAAVQQGLLPDPLQGTVGSMSGLQLFDVINQVKKQSGKVELTAVATTDIHTVGPLKIEIKVQPIL